MQPPAENEAEAKEQLVKKKKVVKEVVSRSGAAVGFGREDRNIVAVGNTGAWANVSCAPLEWLFSYGKLETHLDPEGTHQVRLKSGLAFRSVYEGAQVSPLKAFEFDPMSGIGGSGGGGRPVSDHKIDCIMMLGKLKQLRGFKLLERVLIDGEWIWDKLERFERDRVIERVHRALDDVAVAFKLMDEKAFRRRWMSRGRRT